MHRTETAAQRQDARQMLLATGKFQVTIPVNLSRIAFIIFLAGINLLPVSIRAGDLATNSPGFLNNVALPHYTIWQALDLALKQNPDVLIARKKLEAAAGGVIEARAGFLPALTTYDYYQKLESDYATLDGANPATRNEIWNVSVRLTETAFAGGAVRGKMSIARLNQQTRLYEYQATADRIMMEVRVAFYEILKYRAGIAVHEQAAAFLQKQLAFEKQRLEIGTGQKLNTLRAEVEYSLESAALIDAQNLWRNSYLHLGELLAVPRSSNSENEPFAIEGLLAVEPFTMEESACLSTALQQRPELKARDNDILVQKKQLIVDRSNLLPHINLFVGYDVVSEPDRTFADDYYKGYVAGVGANWNIFDGFATQGRMKATRARVEEAQLAQAAAERNVQVDVVRAFHDLQRALETVKSQKENVELAAQSQSLASANFQEGLITQLDLLQSRLDLTRAQSAELNARFDYNSALAALQRAMGSKLNLGIGDASKP